MRGRLIVLPPKILASLFAVQPALGWHAGSEQPTVFISKCDAIEEQDPQSPPERSVSRASILAMESVRLGSAQTFVTA